jgi:REP element-mobilizing transposase RayT
MPRPSHRWRFITINTHGSWLPGDKRGFRNRGHRIHSSGDYKNRPPVEEHEGLRIHNENRSVTRIEIPKRLRAVIGRAIVARLAKEGYRVLAISVSSDHAHILVELPDNVTSINQIIGRCKRAACDAVKHDMPGTIWSEGCDRTMVDDRDHQENCFKYTLTEQGPRAWTWSFKDGETDALIE